MLYNIIIIVKNIFNSDSIMYKTGDIGFYKEDGEINRIIEFDGR